MAENMKKKKVKYVKFWLWENATLICIDKDGKYSYFSDFFKEIAGDWLEQFTKATNVTRELTKREAKKFLKEWKKVKKMEEKEKKIRRKIKKLKAKLR